MEFVNLSLLCVLVSIASAGPAALRLHQDADIPDSDLTSDMDHDWLDLWLRSHYTALQTSSESQSSEESSEEPAFTQAPPTDPLPPASSVAPTGVPVAMTTAGVITPGTDLPIVDNSTVPEPCPTSGCVTVDIPTSPPVTGSRGDN